MATVVRKKIGKEYITIRIDHKSNTMTTRISKINYPIATREVDEFMAFHYEVKSKRMVGLTVVHLSEFMAEMKQKVKQKEARMQAKRWFKERAAQSVFALCKEKRWEEFYTIPLWDSNIASSYMR